MLQALHWCACLTEDIPVFLIDEGTHNQPNISQCNVCRQGERVQRRMLLSSTATEMHCAGCMHGIWT